MIPLSDDNPTLQPSIMTYTLLGVTVAVWAVVQGLGLDAFKLASSVCDYGMVPGEVTRQAALGTAVPMGQHAGQAWVCQIDDSAINTWTPLTSMFLHGSWGHLLGNCLFLWVFGNNVEDSMGRARFLVFYLVCGFAAAAAHVLLDPSSPVPTVGASGAISGTLGAYLLLYPKVRVKVLFPPIFLVHMRAWTVLVMWFAWQVIGGLPQLMSVRREVSGGVAVWAHVGGFVAGALLIRLFQDREMVQRRSMLGDARAVFDPSA